MNLYITKSKRKNKKYDVLDSDKQKHNIVWGFKVSRLYYS